REVEIEIKLPRGHYAEEILDALYGFTECEVSLNSQIIVIKDDNPLETDVNEVLKYNADKLVEYHKKELEIDRSRLKEKIFYKTLERIFIEKRLYKKIEKIKTLEGIHKSLEDSLKPYVKKMLRSPNTEDRERLLQIPIRRISQFDIDKNKEEICLFEDQLKVVEKHLKNVKKFTIEYLKILLSKYADLFPRRTKIKAIEEIDRRAIETKEIKVGFDIKTGFVGKKVSGSLTITCTNFDKIIVLCSDGTYKVIAIPEKQYFEHAIWVGVADKKTIFNAIYSNKDTSQPWAKRFVVEKFILDKTYKFFEEGSKLVYFSASSNPLVEIHYMAKGKDKGLKEIYAFKDTTIMGVSTKGIKISNHKLKKVIEKN
ncbi:MAG: DNA topoisomerase IV subunit A, partial [Chlamydiae bacterium]|nr:DNA topoisomerase IV subunit A [Chlamydiota bacterium]